MKITHWILVILVIATQPACTVKEESITLAIVPYENPEILEIKYNEFINYLSDEVGIKFDVIICSSYAVAIEALASGQAHLAEFGVFPYFLAKREAGAKALFMPQTGKTEGYTSIIIVRTDSGIDSVEELAGKSFAFVDPSSTSGFLFPMAIIRKKIESLQDANIDVLYAGSHQAVVESVENKSVDAGATYDRAPELYARNQNGIRIIARSEPIPFGVLAAGPELLNRPKLHAKIVDAIKRLNTIPDNEAYKALGIQGYMEVDDDEFMCDIEVAINEYYKYSGAEK